MRILTGARLLGACLAIFVASAAVDGALIGHAHALRLAIYYVGMTAGVVGLFVAVPWTLVDFLRRRRRGRAGSDLPRERLT